MANDDQYGGERLYIVDTKVHSYNEEISGDLVDCLWNGVSLLRLGGFPSTW